MIGLCMIQPKSAQNKIGNFSRMQFKASSSQTTIQLKRFLILLGSIMLLPK